MILNKMKQTAVEWLEEFMTNGKQKSIGIISLACAKAKEMEKEQIIALAAELYEDMFGIDGKEYAIDYYNKLKE
jgi:hypothetical protein